MILVDTSVWIDHPRSGDAGLKEHLQAGRLLGEPALGNLRGRQVLLTALQDLPQANTATDPEVMRFIASHQLYGLGMGPPASAAVNRNASASRVERPLAGEPLHRLVALGDDLLAPRCRPGLERRQRRDHRRVPRPGLRQVAGFRRRIGLARSGRERGDSLRTFNVLAIQAQAPAAALPPLAWRRADRFAWPRADRLAWSRADRLDHGQRTTSSRGPPGRQRRLPTTATTSRRRSS